MTKAIFIISIITLSINAQITVVEPAFLSNLIKNDTLPQGSIRYNISMFGDIHYSEFQNLEVLLPEVGNAYGCEELYTPKLAKKQQFAFLLKRGKCSFSKKAHNAKLVGAAMVFIFFKEEKDYSTFMSYFMFAPYYKENMIPAILLDHNASQKIKNALSEETKVILKVALQVENERHETSSLEYVMVVNNIESYQLLSRFAEFTRSLDSKLEFQPVYYFKQIQLKDFKEVNGIEDESVSQHCFHGKYCLHHDNKPGSFSLGEYFDEGLRQLCLWQQADQKIQWWKYIENYRLRCLESRQFKTLRACFENIMKDIKLQVLVASIDKCVQDSQITNDKGIVQDNSSKPFFF